MPVSDADVRRRANDRGWTDGRDSARFSISSLRHLIAFLEHTQQQTMTGQLIITSYEQLRLEMGTTGFMTDFSYKTMKETVTKTWITDLWGFLGKFQIQLRDDVRQLWLQRRNDKSLMDEFIKAGCNGMVLK
jgi:hypothetical protein